MKAAKLFLTSAFLVFAVSVCLVADVPHFINYQGRLMDDAGNPLNATVELDFGIYTGESGTGLLWHEVHPSVSVVDGLFSVFLGSGNPMPDSIFDGSVLWLGIKVNDGPIMDPLTPFIATPYSFRSIYADTAEYALNAPTGASVWSQSGNYVRLPDVGDSVGIGVLNPVEKLHVGGNLLLGAYGDIRFSPDNTRIDCESNDLQIKAQSDLYLEPYDDLYIRRRDGGSSWAHFDNSTQRLGIGILDPPYKLTVNGEISIANGGVSKYHINYYQGGLNIAETGVQDRRIHISDGGNVGIGTAGAQEKLHVAGNAKINDTIKVGAFEADAISSVNISDETGTASYASYSFNTLSDSWQTIVSRSIDVPGPGYVLAIASAQYYVEHGAFGSSRVLLGIADTPDSLKWAEKFEYYLPREADAGDYYVPVACHRLFPVSSADTYTYYFLAKRYLSDSYMSINRRVFTLVYIPTAYGTVPTKEDVNEADLADNLQLRMEDGRDVYPNDIPEIIPELKSKVNYLEAELEVIKQRLERFEP